MLTEYLKKIEPSYSGYQELHVHTVGSFRDAANTVKDVFDAAEEQGRNAVAITDHGNWTRLFEALKERTKREKKILEKELSAIGADEDEIRKALKVMGNFDSVRCPNEKMAEFIEKYEPAYVNTAKKAIQYIPGIEMYEGLPEDGDDHRWHIIFYAKDWEGAQALFAMCNLAQLNKHGKEKDMPCCTTETMRLFLGKGSRGYGHVIATSACIQGKLAATLLKPYYNSEGQRELLEKQEAMTVIPQETIADGEHQITEMTAEIAAKRAELSEAKKMAKKSYAPAIKKAQAVLEKARQKAPSPDQLSFESMGSDADNTDVSNARIKLESLMAEAKKAESIQHDLPQMEQEVADCKERLKRAKEALANLVKQNRPAQRIEEKIKALQDEAEVMGDVFEEARKAALEYEEILGKGNFFIELQDHGLMQEMITRSKLSELSEVTGIPMTVANDVHYKTLNMKRKRDIIAALRFKNTTVADVKSRVGADQMYFKSNDEMLQLFSDFPEAIANTNRIAEACNVYYQKEMHLPEFVDEKEGLTPAAYLKKMAVENIQRRYPDYDKWGTNKKKELDERLEYELGIIEKMGYSSYIAIVEDFISYTKHSFGPDSVGPGRGSGAGSLVCYLTGITNIDPLRYNLIFERFLNPERVSMPKQYWATIVNPITQGCAA